VIDILDPSAVVLGGGVSNLDLLYDEGPARVARHVFNKMKSEVAALSGAEWGKPAPLVQLRFAHSRG
jgi:predicted NBD/HSP70 family sugar kinase